MFDYNILLSILSSPEWVFGSSLCIEIIRLLFLASTLQVFSQLSMIKLYIYIL